MAALAFSLTLEVVVRRCTQGGGAAVTVASATYQVLNLALLAARKPARGRRRPANAACPPLGGAAGAAEGVIITDASPMRLESPREFLGRHGYVRMFSTLACAAAWNLT